VDNSSSTADMRSVDHSLWAIANGRPTRLHQRHVDLIGRNERSAVDNVAVPSTVGKIVVCVSYELDKQRVNVIDVYTKEQALPLQRGSGEMTRSPESSVRTDDTENLCAAMPRPIAGLR